MIMYCDFVRTLWIGYSFVEVEVLLCTYILERLIVLSLSRHRER